MSFIAKRNKETGSFALKYEGCEFGKLSNCEVCYVFETDNEELADYVKLEGDMSIREMLAEIRRGYEAYSKDQRSICEMETYAENAWLRHSERYDHEAQIDLELHDYLAHYA